MKVTVTRIIAAKDCEFTLNGKNLAEMRRFRINRIATAIKVDVEDSKNATLTRVLGRLRAMEAAPELSEIL